VDRDPRGHVALQTGVRVTTGGQGVGQALDHDRRQSGSLLHKFHELTPNADLRPKNLNVLKGDRHWAIIPSLALFALLTSEFARGEEYRHRCGRDPGGKAGGVEAGRSPPPAALTRRRTAGLISSDMVLPVSRNSGRINLLQIHAERAATRFYLELKCLPPISGRNYTVWAGKVKLVIAGSVGTWSESNHVHSNQGSARVSRIHQAVFAVCVGNADRCAATIDK
jgi:hypothetical protein